MSSIDLIGRELVQVVRGLVRAPFFTLTVGLVVALGVGASTAIFSAVDALVLRPLPYPEPERLVELRSARRAAGREIASGLSLLDFRDLEDGCESLERLALYRGRTFAFAASRSDRDGGPAVIPVGQTTAGFLAVLGVSPALGRFWSREEEIERERVVVLSDRLWRGRLGADRDVVGRRVFLNEERYVVAGILPTGFAFPIGDSEPDAFVALDPETYGVHRNVRTLSAVGRLGRGVTLEAAAAELEALAEALAESHPETNAGWGFAMEDLHEALHGANRRPLTLLAAAGFVLLLITVLDVANLLVARFLARRHRLAMRAVLGARPGSLARLFFLEGALLSALGAVVGIGVAGLCLRSLPAVLAILGGTAPPALGLDVRVLGVALAIALATTLVFTLVPALLARRGDLAQLVKDSSPPASWRQRLRSVLVVAQIALSMVLALAAGLLGRSFLEVLSVDPGFAAEGVVRFGLGLPEKRYDSEEKILEFHRALRRHLARIDGVEAVGAAARLPVGPRRFRTRFELDGKPVSEDSPRAAINVVDAGFFEALGIPRVAGRSFTERDTEDSPRVALVNRAFLREHLSEEMPQRQLALSWWSGLHPRGVEWEVVGVVGDVRQQSLERAPEPAVYLSLGQFPVEGFSYLVKSGRRDRGFFEELAAAVVAVDPGLEQPAFRPLAELLSNSLHDRRLALVLTGLFAAVALGLSGVGVYGVVAFAVIDERREVAVRRALGARERQVERLVLARGLRLAVPGIVLGTVLFSWAGRLLESQLYGIGRMDPWTILGAALVLVVLALAASYVPSRRAARTLPRGVL